MLGKSYKQEEIDGGRALIRRGPHTHRSFSVAKKGCHGHREVNARPSRQPSSLSKLRGCWRQETRSLFLRRYISRMTQRWR
jgi:hypothetical protein